MTRTANYAVVVLLAAVVLLPASDILVAANAPIQAISAGANSLNGSNSVMNIGQTAIGSAQATGVRMHAGVIHALVANLPTPHLLSAVSRRFHGGNAFDINVSPGSSSAVECREGGPQQVIIHFDRDIAPAVPTANVDVVASHGTITSVNVSGAIMNVILSGVPDQVNLTLSFPGITAVGATIPVSDVLCFGVLAGDMRSLANLNPDRVTNVFDMLLIKANLNQVTNAGNFRADVRSLAGPTPDGVINVFDALTIKANINQSLANTCP